MASYLISYLCFSYKNHLIWELNDYINTQRCNENFKLKREGKDYYIYRDKDKKILIKDGDRILFRNKNLSTKFDLVEIMKAL